MLAELFSDSQLRINEDRLRPLEKCHKGRSVQVETLFGPVTIARNYYYHPPSGTGRCPLDDSLGLVDGCSPALARLMCHAAAKSGSYSEAACDLNLYAGVSLQSRAFERLVKRVAPQLGDALQTLAPPADLKPIPVLYASIDGTGVPMRREELEGREGRQPDGSAKTREAKLGCVFTQSAADEKGRPIRDPESTSHVGTFSGCENAGILLRAEALRRGLGMAVLIVFLGDGAPWVWECARKCFKGAIEILDFFHAALHARQLADALFGTQSPQAVAHRKRWIEEMEQSSPDAMLQEARDMLESTDLPQERRDAARTEIAYFEKHTARTRYAQFRAQGLFIGSGVIEAGCKTVVGRRLKQSGMFWSETGAEALLSLRCLVLGPHFDEAWAARRQLIHQQQLVARRWLPDSQRIAA